MSTQKELKETTNQEYYTWRLFDNNELVGEDDINELSEEYQFMFYIIFAFPIEMDEDDVYNDLKAQGHIN